MTRILCLDLGTSYGWAELSDGKIVASGEEKLPPSSKPMGERWLGFREWLRERMVEKAFDAIVYEQPFGRYKNVLQIQFGMATVVELVAEDFGLEYMGLQPGHIKKFATGKGNCRKEEMTSALFARFDEFGEEPPPPDIGENEVDAIWIALYVGAELSVEADPDG